MIPLTDTSTLREAKDQFYFGLAKGTRCPCCDRYSKLYRRKFTAGMGAFLIAAYKKFQLNWFHVVRDYPGVWKTSGGNYSLLSHWGLVESQLNNNEAKSSSGVWRLTFDAVRLINAELTVPDAIYLHNNELRRVSSKLVSLKEIIGVKFDYQELMTSS